MYVRQSVAVAAIKKELIIVIIIILNEVKIHQLFSLMNPNKGLAIIFAPDSINSDVISDLLLNLDKKIELSVTGFYNDISNTYIDNSIICFKW